MQSSLDQQTPTSKVMRIVNRDLRQQFESHPYLIALGSVGIAFVIQLAFASWIAPISPYLFFFGAIAFASWLGGAGPGFAAVAFSTFAVDYFLIEPASALSDKSMMSLVSLLVFAVEGALICGLFHVLRNANEKLMQTLEATEAARDRAEEANQMKRNFIANMSHEIRAPLSAVLGFSEMLANDNATPEQRKADLDRLKVNAASLTGLVTDLLDVTELDSATFIANRKKISLRNFMQNAYEGFSHQAQDKGLKFHIQLRGQLPTHVESDPEQLMQILKNVVGNAIRYSDHGAVTLSVSASKNESGHREVGFVVSDQGNGIPSEIKRRLFKPFPREGLGLAKNYGGAGMGLALARRLARGLGGDVKLAKSDRKGSNFLITFDAGVANEANEFFEALADASRVPQVSPDDPHALDGVRVLVVDDSPDSALLVSRMLRLVGAEVETAGRAQEGIEKALNGRCDLVLMDIQMPEMDGNEATRALRAQGFSNPIIALSAHVMKEDQEVAEQSGVNEYLMKPVSRRALLGRVSHYVRRNKARMQSHIATGPASGFVPQFSPSLSPLTPLAPLGPPQI